MTSALYIPGQAAALEDSDWHEDAVSTIVGLAASQHTITADDLRREMRPAPHPNMIGRAFNAARVAGYITTIGYSQSTAKSRNKGVVRVWTRCTERKS
jgi:hypothetical protein